jgi:hypothetical protein
MENIVMGKKKFTKDMIKEQILQIGVSPDYVLWDAQKMNKYFSLMAPEDLLNAFREAFDENDKFFGLDKL